MKNNKIIKMIKISTNLMSNTKIYIPIRSYPGGLPTVSTGGIGKGPKLPTSNSTGTKVPPTNLTPSQTKDAVLLPNNNNSQPYKVPQHISETEKASNIPKSITPFNRDIKKNEAKARWLQIQEKKKLEKFIKAENKFKEENVPKISHIPFVPQIDNKPKIGLGAAINIAQNTAENQMSTPTEHSTLFPIVIPKISQPFLIKDTSTKILEEIAHQASSINPIQENLRETLKNIDTQQTSINTYDYLKNKTEKHFLDNDCHKIINDYKVISQEKWSEKKTYLLKDMNKLLALYHDLYPKTPVLENRDLEEYNKIFSAKNIDMKNPTILEAEKFLIKESVNITITPEQIKEKINWLEQGLSILINSGNLLPSIILNEIIRRSGVTKNNDAMYKDDYGNNIVKKESEGPMLDRKIYSLLTNKEFDIAPLTSEQHKQILNNILEGSFSIQIFKHSLTNEIPNNNKVIESGEETHMNLVTWYKDDNNNKVFVSPGYLTSNIDNTFLLTNYQYIGGKNKEQRFRVSKQYIIFSPNTLEEHVEATTFVHNKALKENNNYVDVHQRIIDAINLNEKTLKTTPARHPYIFSQSLVQELTCKMFRENIDSLQNQYNKLSKDLDNMSDTL